MTGPAVQAASAKDRVELANRLLSQHRYGTAEHERGYTLMNEAAESADGAWAQWLLGAYHLQVIQRPQSQTTAAHWLRRAAAAGVPPAIERLADMSLDGIAMPFSLDEGMAGLRILAERGHAPSAWQLAYLSDRPGASDTGVAPATLLLRACALGFGPAYYSLGLRFANGNGLERDPVLGRALLLRAVDAGFRDAQDAADELAPEGGAAADALRASLKANLAAAQPMLAAVGRGDALSAQAIDPMLPKLESHLAMVVQPVFFVDEQGRACIRDAGRRASVAAVDWQWTTGLPKVGVAADFADREECAWLINKVAGAMLRPEQIARQHSANTDSELKQFNGHVRPLKMLDTDPVMRMLQRRIVETLAWRPTHMEPCSIISYGPGHEYLPHCDYFTEEQIALNREHTGDLGGQRVATFLAYLHAPDRGGETEYPHGGLLVSGRRGTAVVHYNVADGMPDPASLHAGRPVLEGEKWLWRSTLREHSMYA